MILGPITKEDGDFLKAIIMLTTPKTVVEFGYFMGDSARAILSVLDNEATLHSFDNQKDTDIEDRRFIFHKKSQEEISDIKDIDLVFLDASHNLELNKKTFDYLKDNMSEKGIIIVHDTGSWVGGNIFNISWGKPDKKGNWIHQPGEVDFVNYVLNEYPNWQQIHLHSNREVRHGMTLLQNKNML